MNIPPRVPHVGSTSWSATTTRFHRTLVRSVSSDSSRPPRGRSRSAPGRTSSWARSGCPDRRQARSVSSPTASTCRRVSINVRRPAPRCSSSCLCGCRTPPNLRARRGDNLLPSSIHIAPRVVRQRVIDGRRINRLRGQDCASSRHEISPVGGPAETTRSTSPRWMYRHVRSDTSFVTSSKPPNRITRCVQLAAMAGASSHPGLEKTGTSAQVVPAPIRGAVGGTRSAVAQAE